MNHSATTVSRLALYEEVWAAPVTKLAVKYRVSGTGLAKACRKSNIPLPPPGYWSKRQNGKPVMRRPPLPSGTSGIRDTITIRPSKPVPGIDPIGDERADDEHRSENRILVSGQLHNPHPLVKDASIAPFNFGQASRERSGDHQTAAMLDIRVSPATRNRALRLLDALLKALEVRGYTVNARGVMVEDELVPIGVTEKEDQVPHVPTAPKSARNGPQTWLPSPKWDSVPNGRLSIHTSAYVWWRTDLRKRWSDGRTTRLEDMLNDIVVGLVAIGVALHQRADEERQNAEARAAVEQARQERARLVHLEQVRREKLIASADAWDRATRIKHFVAEVERRLITNRSAAPDIVHAWIAWANSVADDFDPLGDGLDGFLRNAKG